MLLSQQLKETLFLGASEGIGAEIAYYYSQHQAKVVVIARNEDKLKAVVNKCNTLGASSATYLKADLSTSEASYYEQVIAEATSLLGGVDTLVLNHVASTNTVAEKGYYNNFDMEMTRWMYQVNVFSHMALAQAATPLLEAS